MDNFITALRDAVKNLTGRQLLTPAGKNNDTRAAKARGKEIADTMPHINQYENILAPEEVTPPESDVQLIPTQSNSEAQLIPNAKQPIQWVEYTYQPGDNFSNVLMNLGLSDGSNLWGPNGDVAYYTQQLAEQGALDSRGNIKVGSNIRLIKRGRPFDEPVLV